ncbi:MULTISPECIES: hypothetical protein [unclassified Micromonospora]|uniref:hypothetical protein n=1 Tax=unclassified Micromonospora TaxID=2617518 RepID=UPI001C5EDABD|nr:hypothetical protein [Micromonospora sp. RL09-050-HVF-A]MBW4701504.1 hypothetical protein [Micromonospora sp. RL09-050-HVF-A]
MGNVRTDNADDDEARPRPGRPRTAAADGAHRTPSALDAWARANRRGQCDWADPETEPHLIRGLD